MFSRLCLWTVSLSSQNKQIAPEYEVCVDYMMWRRGFDAWYGVHGLAGWGIWLVGRE